jgi:transketolase
MAVIGETTKGKGVSFMENEVKWHYRPPNPEELSAALEELADYEK